MPNVLISPVFNLPSIQNAEGTPFSGAKIFTYEAGSNSVLKATYTTEAGDVENANPIVLDSSGRLPEAIWLEEGEAYNLVLTQADGTTVVKGFDNIVGVAGPTGGGGGGSTAVWITAPGGTYLSTTQFLVPGNYTSEFKVGNRARVTVTGGFRYGTVTAVSFSSPNTTVTLAVDSSTLNSSLSLVEYSVLIGAAGSTVDAGGVSYTSTLTYATTGTVGWKIKNLETTLTASITAVDDKRERMSKIWSTTGSGADANYVLTPTPAITSYTEDSIWLVRFASSSSGDISLNINGVGERLIKQYTSTGALVAADVASGQLSQVVWNNSNNVFILLDRLPAAADTPDPHGQSVFAANGTFTTPADVYRLKITCVGGGGGGGRGFESGGDGSTTYYGGNGGQAALTMTSIATTPGTAYTVAVGAGGTGATFSSSGLPGGNSSFGVTLAWAEGGAAGANASITNGANGADGNSGTGLVLPGNPGFYGKGGTGGSGYLGAGTAGRRGYVYVEW